MDDTNSIPTSPTLSCFCANTPKCFDEELGKIRSQLHYKDVRNAKDNYFTTDSIQNSSKRLKA